MLINKSFSKIFLYNNPKFKLKMIVRKFKIKVIKRIDTKLFGEKKPIELIVENKKSICPDIPKAACFSIRELSDTESVFDGNGIYLGQIQPNLMGDLDPREEPKELFFSSSLEERTKFALSSKDISRGYLREKK